jgi:hypothetical protein
LEELSDIIELEFEVFGLDIIEKSAGALDHLDAGAKTQEPREFVNPPIGIVDALPERFILGGAFEIDEFFFGVIETIEGFFKVFFAFFGGDTWRGVSEESIPMILRVRLF